MAVSDKMFESLEDEVKGVKTTLFGREGRTGLVLDVERNTAFRKVLFVLIVIVLGSPAWLTFILKLSGRW